MPSVLIKLSSSPIVLSVNVRLPDVNYTHNTMYWHLCSVLSKYGMSWFYSNYYTLGLRGIKYIGIAVYRYIKTISLFCFPPPSIHPSPSSPFHLEPMSLACVVPGGSTLLHAHHNLSPHNERCSHLPQATGAVTQTLHHNTFYEIQK